MTCEVAIESFLAKNKRYSLMQSSPELRYESCLGRAAMCLSSEISTTAITRLRKLSVTFPIALLVLDDLSEEQPLPSSAHASPPGSIGLTGVTPTAHRFGQCWHPTLDRPMTLEAARLNRPRAAYR